MPSRPVRFDFESAPSRHQAEAASRRRLRILEQSFPAVLEWEIAARGRAGEGPGHSAQARATAALADGQRLEATGYGTDVLGALRVALNGLEDQLLEETEGSSHPPRGWLGKIRSRAPRSWFGAH